MPNRRDELLAVVDLLGRVAEVDDQEFPAVVLPGLTRIVPCDFATYNEMDLNTSTYRLSVHPFGAVAPESGEILAAYIHEHPIVRYVQRTGDPTPQRMSDVTTRSEFHRLGLYNELFKPARIEFQAAMTLRIPRRTVVGIGLNRSSRDFSDREREVLALLRAPLAAAFERAAHRRRVVAALPRPRADGLTDVLTDREREVLELVAAGRTDGAIAHLLGCSRRTIGKHLQNTYRKLGVTNRVAAVGRLP